MTIFDKTCIQYSSAVGGVKIHRLAFLCHCYFYSTARPWILPGKNIIHNYLYFDSLRDGGGGN